MVETLSKNITRQGLTATTLNYLRVSFQDMKNVVEELPVEGGGVGPMGGGPPAGGPMGGPGGGGPMGPSAAGGEGAPSSQPPLQDGGEPGGPGGPPPTEGDGHVDFPADNYHF